MIDHFTDNNGVSYHRRAEFGFCWVEDKAFEEYQKQQANDFIERLKRRNESRKRRGVHVVSEREAVKRAARYQEALRLEMDFSDYIKWKMYLPDHRYLAMELNDEP